MKNIHTLLSEIGITIPDEKKAEFDKAVLANYKTVAEVEKSQPQEIITNHSLKQRRQHLKSLRAWMSKILKARLQN